MKRRALLALLLVGRTLFAAAPPPPPGDALGRTDPRSSITRFLETCHQRDYTKAAQYLDLGGIPASRRAAEGPGLARDLESVLNSDSHFDALALNPQPQSGNEHLATVTLNGQSSDLDLVRVTPASGPAIWLLSRESVARLPKLVPIPSAESAIEARLPRFLVANELVETPLWKWIALLLAGAILVFVARALVAVARSVLSRRLRSFAWLHAILEPLLVIVAVAGFRIFEELVNPSALSRLYINRLLLLAVVWSVAWSLINLFDLFLRRLDTMLDPRQRVVAHSLIYLARRVGKVLIFSFAIIIVLDNWGFSMTTIIAGLGVGGIAVALAAQQTIANVFGGVSVISDSPVMIGDFGNFGGVIGNVEEIGMRSARIRTLNRTVVSIPNSVFATANLENYALRDKILFNPTIQIKRATSKESVRRLMTALHDVLASKKEIQIGPSPVRISGYSAAAFTLEIFAYVLTADIDEYYKHQAELYLAMDDAVSASGVELA